jgi:hypothetical protein
MYLQGLDEKRPSIILEDHNWIDICDGFLWRTFSQRTQELLRLHKKQK